MFNFTEFKNQITLYMFKNLKIEIKRFWYIFKYYKIKSLSSHRFSVFGVMLEKRSWLAVC